MISRGAASPWSRIAAFFAVGVAALCCVQACRHTASPPNEPAPSSSPRVVALSPAVARTMRDLGLGKYLVGRHGFDQWSAQSLPVCGDQNGIDYETLVRARPTQVFLQVADVPDRLE